MKNIIWAGMLLLSSTCLLAQESPKTWIKFNAPAVLVGVPQIGLEHHFHPAWSYQIDMLGSFWKSVRGVPLEIGMLSNEVRYYYAKQPTKWFTGINVTGATYHLQKWDYWGTDYVQKGHSAIFGLTFGYTWHIHKKLKGEVFASVGTQQAWYKGYNKITGERMDPITHGGWNKSGEIIPYRAGFMLNFPWR